MELWVVRNIWHQCVANLKDSIGSVFWEVLGYGAIWGEPLNITTCHLTKKKSARSSSTLMKCPRWMGEPRCCWWCFLQREEKVWLHVQWFGFSNYFTRILSCRLKGIYPLDTHMWLPLVLVGSYRNVKRAVCSFAWCTNTTLGNWFCSLQRMKGSNFAGKSLVGIILKVSFSYWKHSQCFMYLYTTPVKSI